MNPDTDFTKELFEQFTFDLSRYSTVVPVQDENSLDNMPLGETYSQGTNAVNFPALTDLSSQTNVNVNMSVQDIGSYPQNTLNTPLPTPSYCSPLVHPYSTDIEEFLTPLVSPAITPNITDVYQFLDSSNEQYFTPLSSPALIPNTESTGYLNSFPLNFGDASGDVINPSISTTESSNSSINNIEITDSTSMSNTTHASNDTPDNKVGDEVMSNIQDPSILAQQLAQIEAKQQILRDQMKMSPLMSPTYRKSPLGLYSSGQQNPPPSPLAFNTTKKRTSLRQRIALASPKLQSTQHRLKPQTTTAQSSRTPATPASLMKIAHTSTSSQIPSDRPMVDVMPSLPPAAMSPPSLEPIVKKRKLAPISPIPSSSPRTLRPLISPFLQPSLDMSSSQVSSPNVEHRRSAHKVAEQRRRDTLKQSFDSLRKEILEVLIEDSGQPIEAIKEEKEKEVKLMSKVLLLQHSYEYIVRLKTESQVKDEKIMAMEQELKKLNKLAQEQSKDV